MIFVDAQDDRRGDEERARQADRDRRLQAPQASTWVLRAVRRVRRRRGVGVDEGYGLLEDALHVDTHPSRTLSRSRSRAVV